MTKHDLDVFAYCFKSSLKNKHRFGRFSEVGPYFASSGLLYDSMLLLNKRGYIVLGEHVYSSRFTINPMFAGMRFEDAVELVRGPR